MASRVQFAVYRLLQRFVVIMGVGGLLTGVANAQALGPRNLSNSGSAQTPVIGVDSAGKIINVVWADKSSGNYQIFFSRSVDGGSTFSRPKNLSNSATDSQEPQLALDSTGNINVAWRENNAGVYGLFYARSADGGASFTTPKSIPVGGSAYDLHLAVDSKGNVNILWIDWSDATYCSDLRFTRSADAGSSFASSTLASGCWPYPSYPELVIDIHDSINVAWESDLDGDSNIYFTRSLDGGVTFDTPAWVDHGGVQDLRLLVDPSGNVSVVWADTGFSDYRTYGSGIYISRSTATGWFTYQLYSGPSGMYDVGLDDAALYPNGDVLLTFSTGDFLHTLFGNANYFMRDGQTSSQTRIADSGDGLLAVDTGGNINIVWSQGPSGASQVFYGRSTDGGSTFSSPENLSNSLSNAVLSRIASDTVGRTYVVWTESPSASTATDVYFTVFPDTVSTEFKLTVADGCANGACGWFADSGVVTSTPGGIDCGITCSASFPRGSTVTLTATPDSTSSFEGWRGACSGTGTCTVTMDANRTVSATFRTPHLTWNINFAGTGSGVVREQQDWFACSSNCIAELPIGSFIDIAASPNPGSVFAAWSGPCSGTGHCQGSFNTDQTLTATFNALQSFPLTVTRAGAGSGAITSDDGKINCGTACSATYYENEAAFLTATPAAGSVFASWSGGCTGTDECVVAMSAARSVSAIFNQTPVNANLSLTIIESADPMNAGSNLTYSISVSNSGPAAANNAVLTHTLPPGSAFVSASPAQGTCSHSSGVVTCNLGNIPVSGSVALTVVVNESSPGSITSAVSVASSSPDPNNSDNAASSVTTVVGVGITPAVGSASILAGQSATFSFAVTPEGGAFTNPVTFACALPAQMLMASCSFAPATVTPNSASASSILTVRTTATQFAAMRHGRWSALWLMLPGVMLTGINRRRHRRALYAFFALLAFMVVLQACGGGGASPNPVQKGTPPGTYTVGVTANSGTFQRSSNVTVVVQ